MKSGRRNLSLGYPGASLNGHMHMPMFHLFIGLAVLTNANLMRIVAQCGARLKSAFVQDLIFVLFALAAIDPLSKLLYSGMRHVCPIRVSAGFLMAVLSSFSSYKSTTLSKRHLQARRYLVVEIQGQAMKSIQAPSTAHQGSSISRTTPALEAKRARPVLVRVFV